MPIREHQILSAPVGMDITTDPPHIDQTLAREIIGFLPGRNSRLHSAPDWWNFNIALPQPLNGVAWYEDSYTPTSPSRTDQLIAVQGAQPPGGVGCNVYSYPILTSGVSNGQSAYRPLALGAQTFLAAFNALPAPAYNQGSFRVRTAQYRDEMFMLVDMGGMRPWRILRDTTAAGGNFPMIMRNCGMATPGGSPVVADGAAGSVTAGVHKVRYTEVDERGRESSPSAANVATFTAGGAKKADVTGLTRLNDGQMVKAYVYMTTAGGFVYYRAGTIADATTTTISLDVSDANLQALTPMPLIGENDRPNYASCMCVHKDRLWLNDRSAVSTATDYASLSRVQVSNQGNPTQFSSVTDLDRPTDGTSLIIGSDNGNEVMGMASLGSILIVFKRTSCYGVWGDAPSDFPGVEGFSIRHIADVGCIATDSIVTMLGSVYWRGEDAYYTMGAHTGLEPRRISGPLERVLTGMQLPLATQGGP